MYNYFGSFIQDIEFPQRKKQMEKNTTFYQFHFSFISKFGSWVNYLSQHTLSSDTTHPYKCKLMLTSSHSLCVICTVHCIYSIYNFSIGHLPILALSSPSRQPVSVVIRRVREFVMGTAMDKSVNQKHNQFYCAATALGTFRLILRLT